MVADVELQEWQPCNKWSVKLLKKKISQGASHVKCQTVSILKCYKARGGSLSGNVGAGRSEPHNNSISAEV